MRTLLHATWAYLPPIALVGLAVVGVVLGSIPVLVLALTGSLVGFGVSARRLRAALLECRLHPPGVKRGTSSDTRAK